MTPLFPDYTRARALLKYLEGKPKATYNSMMKAIWELIGTPQNPVDWTDPDMWIEERLTGEDKQFAMEMWRHSGGAVNPRHVRGSNFLLSKHKLISDAIGIMQLTTDGKDFIANDEGSAVSAMDEQEGIHKILRLFYAKTSAKTADVLDDWQAYLIARTNYKKKGAIYTLLIDRISNLLDRGYLSKQGHTYTITDLGIAYLKLHESEDELEQDRSNEAMEAEVRKQVSGLQAHQRKQLREALSVMNPYHFEHLVRELLEAMGYSDVEVTKMSNDGGVDVIGEIEVGITHVKEVVQVKRKATNVSVSVVNQLRGVVPLHNAMRGTIITTSDFTKSAINSVNDARGVPITLIDGDKLIDLMIDFEVGTIQRSFDYFVVDDEYFNNREAVI